MNIVWNHLNNVLLRQCNSINSSFFKDKKKCYNINLLRKYLNSSLGTQILKCVCIFYIYIYNGEKEMRECVCVYESVQEEETIARKNLDI